VSSAHGKNGLDIATARTPACIPIERLGDARTQEERAHIETCARCQAELSLWQEFDRSTPAAGDGAAVQWIAAKLARRRVPASAAGRRTIGWIHRPALSAAMATLVVAAAFGYVLWDREPPVPRGVTSPVYRAGRIRTSAPLGDVASAPSALHWSAAEGAASYDVRVLEVDRTPLWSGSTSTPGIDLPSEVSALFVPGKTVVWEVTARDRSRAVIGESGAQQFRVAPSSRDR
jgi:hypothetical protein